MTEKSRNKVDFIRVSDNDEVLCVAEEEFFNGIRIYLNSRERKVNNFYSDEVFD